MPKHVYLDKTGKLYASWQVSENSGGVVRAIIRIDDIHTKTTDTNLFGDNVFFTTKPDKIGGVINFYSTYPSTDQINANNNSSNNATIYSLDVREGTSPLGGNTLYIGNENGVIVVQEKQGDESNGSVKYITSEYETEEMVGNVRGMWTFDGSDSLSDNSVNTNDLTNNGEVDFNSAGVRGKAASF